MRRVHILLPALLAAENLIGGKTTLCFDLYCSEVVIFLFAAAAAADMLLVHDIILLLLLSFRVCPPTPGNVLITCTTTLFLLRLGNNQTHISSRPIKLRTISIIIIITTRRKLPKIFPTTIR